MNLSKNSCHSENTKIHYPNKINVDTLLTQSVSKTEYMGLINNFKYDTAAGHDYVSVKLFKRIV